MMLSKLQKKVKKIVISQKQIPLFTFFTDRFNFFKGLTSFVDFLKNLGSNEVILVSHNNLNYDSVVLLKNLNQWDITLPQYVKFVDSMDIMNNLRKSTGNGTHLEINRGPHKFNF